VLAHFDLPKIDSARIFGQLSILSMNISGMNQDIDKPLTAFLTTICSTLNAKQMDDLGSLTTKLCLLISTYPTSRVRAFWTTLDFDCIYLENGLRY